MTNEERVEPCPFCGAKDITPWNRDGCVLMYCEDCCAEGPKFRTSSNHHDIGYDYDSALGKAKRAWNSRISPDPQIREEAIEECARVAEAAKVGTHEWMSNEDVQEANYYNGHFDAVAAAIRSLLTTNQESEGK
jgi:hypothetical protein